MNIEIEILKKAFDVINNRKDILSSQEIAGFSKIIDKIEKSSSIVKEENSHTCLEQGKFLQKRNIELEQSNIENNNKIIAIENKLQENYKMVVMGKMIDSIAHQWTQPLSVISLYSKMLVEDYKYNIIDAQYISEITGKVDLQINHLLNTLHEFRNFLRPTKPSDSFYLKDAVKSVLVLLQDVIKGNQISVNINENPEDNLELYGSKSEFENVIINIINNSKDAFIENKVKKRVIDINIFLSNKKYIEISDNAGGIPLNILDNIFDINFTTKDKNGGTGVGLYLTKLILDKLYADIRVENINSGAKFTIVFKKDVL